jgi:hypothetical protein
MAMNLSVPQTSCGEHHPLQVSGRQIAAGRKAKSPIEKGFGDSIYPGRVLLKYGLQVHRLPQRTGFDIFFF